MVHEIDYSKVIKNLNSMVNILEYDSMRSAGKAKLNSQHLDAMYNLLDRYKSKVKPIPQPKKEG